MSGNPDLQIAVCDDEAYVHDTMRSLLESYTQMKGVNCEVSHFHSAQELLQSDREPDLLFLDIDMPDMDGIEAAHILNARGMSGKILMLTSKVERFKEAFKIGAFRFVTKPIEERELFESLDEAREHMAGMERITVYRDGAPYEVIQRDILYIMADGDATRILTRDRDYRSERPLKKWARELDERIFFLCHRGYLVNLGKLERIEKEVAYTVTGEKVPIARRKRTALLQAYMEYDTRRR